MGGAASVKAPPDPESLTPESLGDLVGSIGLKYAELKQHFIDNGIDGHYIMHLKPEEVDETFEALEITSPILKKNLRIKLLELQKGAAAVAGADVASASTVVAAEPEPAKGVATAEPVVVVSADVVSASAVNAEPAAATGAGAAGPEDSTRSGVSSISMPPAAAEDRWWESSRSRRNQSNAPAAASSSSVPPPEEVNVAEKLKEGRALEARSDLDGARECFETALEGSALTVGVENPATMAIVIELARVLRAGGELSAAESFLEHVVRFRAKALGYSHGDTLAAVHQLGLCAAAQGDFVAAKSHYSDALEALERQPDVAADAAALVKLHICVGNTNLKLHSRDVAKRHYEAAIARAERDPAALQPDLLIAWYNLAGLLKRNGDRDAARSYYLRCRDGYAQTKGPAHADTLDAGKLAAALA